MFSLDQRSAPLVRTRWPGRASSLVPGIASPLSRVDIGGMGTCQLVGRGPTAAPCLAANCSACSPLAGGAAVSSILVLDDRATERDLLSTVLGYAGHAVVQASTGEDALSLARAHQPDLIIADLTMPNMNGYEFVRELRADGALESTRVVFCTATYAGGAQGRRELRRVAHLGQAVRARGHHPRGQRGPRLRPGPGGADRRRPVRSRAAPGPERQAGPEARRARARQAPGRREGRAAGRVAEVQVRVLLQHVPRAAHAAQQPVDPRRRAEGQPRAQPD